jgi:hypothetical protein
MRFVRTLISLGFVLFGVAVLLLAVAAYLTATGRSVPVLRTVAGVAGDLMAGQATEQMAVSVSVDPVERRIDGVARVMVKAVEDRRRVYLLLNDGLAVEGVARLTAAGERTPVAHYRLWLMTVVDLGETLAAGGEATLEISYGGDPFGGLAPFGQRVIEADEVILTPTDLWYPTDLRSFFRADVEVTLPASLRPVHAGAAEVITELGSSRRTRWTSTRPVPGVALVAGRHRQHTREEAGVLFRAAFAPRIELDPEIVLQSMADATASLDAACGPSGASRHALFVSPRLRRPFADGSGVVGLPPADFRRGDYGFAAIADGVARSWWGATVAADPTRPGAGGGWVIEGFAANAARRAVRDRFGTDAEFRWRAARAFDPTVAGLLAEASWLDWELGGGGGGTSAAALRNKSAYVAMMLEERVGREAFDTASRQILERYSGRTVTTSDVRKIFTADAGANVETFFDQWVGSVGQVDLSLDPRQGGARLANHQTIEVVGAVDLWRVPPGGQPVEQTIAVGGTTPVGNAERLVVDPRGLLADMYRSNNVLPREDAPRQIARSPRDVWMVVDGEPHDWAPARIRVVDGTGKALHSWSFDLGLLGEPRWSADGTHILAVEPPRGGAAKLYALHPSDGSMVEIGHDTVVHGGAGGYVAARAGRLVAVVDDDARPLATGGAAAADPLISPDGKYVAFAMHRGAEMELRLRGMESSFERVLMTWQRGPVRWQWAPDASRLFAVLAGDWDWQLWEIPVDGAPRPLMQEAAGVRDLALSPDGTRIALAAAPQLDYRREHHEVFLIDRADPARAQQFSVGGYSVVDLSWRDGESLFVVVTDSTYSIMPARRDIKILMLDDGSILPLP